MGVTRVKIVDSHTAGEPTRMVVAGAPDLGPGSLSLRRLRFDRDGDAFRRAVVTEPRGSDVLVGGLLLPPEHSRCAAGVVFFNNVGSLGMCGHGTIGLVATLAHLGRLRPGPASIDTPVGEVTTELRANGEVAVRNVESWRERAAVRLDVPGVGPVVGDLAWGGNWFFLIDGAPAPLVPSEVGRLTEYCLAVRRGLVRSGITAPDGSEVDHIEMSGPPADSRHNARNFVLCPGGAYDRSPCGTGTSAKMACLAADGRLRPGDVWRQEGILGTVFEGTIEGTTRGVRPTIVGRAYVTGEGELLLDDRDPFRNGIPG